MSFIKYIADENHYKEVLSLVEKHPILYDGMERVLCPRVHFKLIIIDSSVAYVDSANLTGAGMGMKSPRKSYFAFLPSPEPTYAKIYDGEWIDDVKPYHVVHRIASYPDAHGIFSSIMDFCFSHDTNIRIDTHRDKTMVSTNRQIMQHNILKHGFTYCGIIYLQSGDERLAYQKMVSR